MQALQTYWLAVLPPLLLLSSLGPGLLLTRRLRLAPLERIVTSAGLSYLLLYVVAFALYAVRAGPGSHVVVAAGYALCTLVTIGDLHRLLRRALVAHALFLFWGLLLLSFVRHFGGGTWSGDWLEHYQRTLFFLEHRPTATLFINQYLLPTRPPMMNVLAAHFLALTGAGYEKFQLVLLYLNALVLPACCLVAGNFFQPRRGTNQSLGREGLVLLFLAASPFVVQNLTYSWTKLFTAFYVILGVHLYLRWLRKRRSAYVVLTFVSLAAGCLVHYSAGPYALFVGLHYAVQLLRGRARWAEAALAGALTVAVLATWFGWSVYAFGPRTTFGSNSTVTDSAKMSAGGNVRNVARNTLNTLVPTVLRDSGVLERDEDLRQPSRDGRVRDFAFLTYQVSLPFALGTAGLAVMIFLLSKVRAIEGRPDERRFWLLFVPFTFAVGVTVYGGVDRFGVAHVTLQPLALLGLSAVAAIFPLAPPWLRRAAVLLLLLDFAVGIQLHFNLQSRDFDTEDGPDGKPIIVYTPNTLSRGAQFNWTTKQREGLAFWADRLKPYLWPMQVLLLFSYGALLAVCLKPYLGPATGLSRRRTQTSAGPW